MASEKPQKHAEGDAFLAMIDTKMAALQTLRASYVAAVSVGAFSGQSDPSTVHSSGSVTPSGAPIELPRGALLGKTLPAAIKLYLSAVKQKQTIREIAVALREGGIESTAANFEGSITTAVNRLKSAGEVLRFKDGWALAEFYPESLRNRIVKDAKPPKKRRRVKRKSQKLLGAKTESTSDSGPKLKLDDRVLAFLNTAHGGAVSAENTSESLGLRKAVVAMALARLDRSGRVEKGADGLYRLT